MTFHDLEEILEDKENILRQVESAVRPLSASQLSFRPAPGVWTVAEIVEHLSITETSMIRVVHSLTEKAESAGGTAALGFEVTLDDGIVTGRTGKIKTRPEAEPTGKIPAERSLESLRAIQADLLGLRPRLSAVDVTAVKFAHRALGDMSLGQWCAFIGAHEARHLGQIRSVISSSGFPG
ncbi:MAG TPA: DinB family protein [Bacteroidota bacterium]|nr:DinB family protein [Bacteroidota bacterium]